ncbi:MAG: hypothetical protein OHK0029_29330 [Armatimonadaceae bacterium]
MGPDQKLPTFARLREELGVSVVTLSNALNELEARQVIYRLPGIGIYVSPKLGHKSVALVCHPGFLQLVGTSPFWDILVEQARERAAARNWEIGYHFTSTGTGETVSLHRGLLQDVQAGRVHGLLSIGGGDNAYAMMEGSIVPFVAYAGVGPYTVEMDQDSGTSIGAKMLVEAGCRRIAFWSPVMPYRVMSTPEADLERRVGYVAAAIREAGGTFDPLLVEGNLQLIRATGGRRQTTVSLVEQG